MSAGKSNRAVRNLDLHGGCAVLPEIDTVGAPARGSVPIQALAPPGVGHLLLWTAGCACYLSIMQVLATVPPSPRGMVLLVLQCLGSGAAIGCVILAMVNRARGVRIVWSPGHWLLVALGVTFLAEALGLRAYPGAAAMVMCWMLLLPTLSRKLSIRWRLTFASLVLLYAVPLVLPMLSIDGGWLLDRPWLEPLATTLVVIAVYGYERFCSVRHDWLHGVGVAVMFWNGLLWMLFKYVL